MKATKTISKRGNVERVDCWHSCTPEYYDRTGQSRGRILLHTEFGATRAIFTVELTPDEARFYAMKILALLDTMQGTLKAEGK